jgi:hypothetical protein
MAKDVILFLLASIMLAQPLGAPRDTTFEGQKAVLLSNSKLQLTVLGQGSTIASVVLMDDTEKLSPLWNPMRLAREAGREARFAGATGHFVCVDGFGQPSAEERTAGMPQHGEAHITRFEMTLDEAGNAVSFSGKLPIVNERFTTTLWKVKMSSM